MKKNICLIFVLTFCAYVNAQITSLNFNLQEGGTKDINFENYNIVTFGTDKFILSSSQNPALTPLEISYDESRSVTVITNGDYGGINTIDYPDAEIVYDNNRIYFGNTSVISGFIIAIYSTKGELLKTSRDSCDISHLPSGVYIAVASNGNMTCTRKIIR